MRSIQWPPCSFYSTNCRGNVTNKKSIIVKHARRERWTKICKHFTVTNRLMEIATRRRLLAPIVLSENLVKSREISKNSSKTFGLPHGCQHSTRACASSHRFVGFSRAQIHALERLFDVEEAYETMLYWLRHSEECRRILNLSLPPDEQLTSLDHERLKNVCL